MSITRLQQARQMYAMGQRVGGIMGSNAGSMLVTPTRDGSRPGYYGPDEGHENDPGHGSNAPGGNEDKGRHNPHTDTGYSKSTPPSSKSYDGPTNIHVDDPKAPPAYEIIGGKKYDVTPETRDERERARVRAQIAKAPLPNITKKGTEYYDPNTGALIGFAPTSKKSFGLLDLALMASGMGLFGSKAKTAAGLFNAYNKAQQISTLAKDIGLTDKNVVDAFTDSITTSFSNTSKGKTSTRDDTSQGGDGDGLASMENMDALNQEYLLLLQKFNTGIFNDADQVRFTFLKKILGK